LIVFRALGVEEAAKAEVLGGVLALVLCGAGERIAIIVFSS
jgi:hypothetical protein